MNNLVGPSQHLLRKKAHNTTSKINGERTEYRLTFQGATGWNLKMFTKEVFLSITTFSFSHLSLPEVFFFFLITFIKNEE